MHAEISSVKYRNSPLLQGELELSYIVFISIPPAALNENLISRYGSLVASFYVEPPKEAEVGSFESGKETDFSVDSTTKTIIQTKKRKSPEMSAEINKPSEKKLAQIKDIWAVFATGNVEKSNDQTSKTENKKLEIHFT